MSAPLPARVIDEGREDLLPVVFLHAFPYHADMWEGQRAAVRGRARFLSFDARGLGPHAPLVPAFMLEHWVDDLLALLDQRGIASCVLCGLSLGGYVALRTLQRAPSRVRGLLLADTQAASDSDQAKLARAAGLRQLASEGKSAFADAQLARQLSPRTLASRASLVARLRAQILESSSDGIAKSLVALATRTDLSPLLGEIRVPTRVIVGADDTITTPEVARALCASIAGADLHVLEGTGHLSNVEAEQDFNRLLLEHLDRIARG